MAPTSADNGKGTMAAARTRRCDPAEPVRVTGITMTGFFFGPGHALSVLLMASLGEEVIDSHGFVC